MNKKIHHDLASLRKMAKQALSDSEKLIHTSVPIFQDFIAPKGFLNYEPESHALFYYYINAQRIYETYIKDTPIVMEGDKDPEYNFQELFNSIARLYKINPEYMANAWSAVDMQCRLLKLPQLPNEARYRFNQYIH